jgi:hypothetical protein
LWAPDIDQGVILGLSIAAARSVSRPPRSAEVENSRMPRRVGWAVAQANGHG